MNTRKWNSLCVQMLLHHIHFILQTHHWIPVNWAQRSLLSPPSLVFVHKLNLFLSTVLTVFYNTNNQFWKQNYHLSILWYIHVSNKPIVFIKKQLIEAYSTEGTKQTCFKRITLRKLFISVNTKANETSGFWNIDWKCLTLTSSINNSVWKDKLGTENEKSFRVYKDTGRCRF